MWSEIAETLTDAFRHHPAVRADLAAAEHAVTHAETTPTVAARALLEKFLGRSQEGPAARRTSVYLDHGLRRETKSGPTTSDVPRQRHP